MTDTPLMDLLEDARIPDAPQSKIDRLLNKMDGVEREAMVDALKSVDVYPNTTLALVFTKFTKTNVSEATVRRWRARNVKGYGL